MCSIMHDNMDSVNVSTMDTVGGGYAACAWALARAHQPTAMATKCTPAKQREQDMPEQCMALML
jgi:hypothetical protein